MKLTKRMEKLENKFIDYSDRVQDIVFFIRDGFSRNMGLSEMRTMKRLLLGYLDEMMSADQKYGSLSSCLLGDTEPHPNYDKFMTYTRIARSLIDNEIVERNLNI